MLSLKSDIDAKKKEKYKFEKLLDRFEDDEDMEIEGAEDPVAFFLTHFAESNGRSYSRFTKQ